jgi:hypothetical protein
MGGLRTTICAGLFLLALPPRAAGQWVVEASAGEAEYEAVAGDVGSVNAILGVRREGSVWASLYAGVPLDSAGIPWASAGAGGRGSRQLSGFDVGVDLGAIGYGYHVSETEASGGGATLIGLPFVGFSRGPGRVEVRSGPLHHTAFFDDGTQSRTVLDTGVRGSFTATPRLSLQAEGRLVKASEAVYPFAGVGAELSAGAALLWLRGSRWMADALESTGWGVGAVVELGGRLAVRASYERMPDDPLYWNGPRSGWSLGVSRGFGRRTPRAPALPVPETFREPAGTVAVRIPVEGAAAPSIAGDFTGWQPVPMRRNGDQWEASFDLEPGVYHYSFVRADGSWFLPDTIRNRVDDGFGGVNAVLVVGS